MAVLKIRKSDGTLRTLEASRTYEPFAECEDARRGRERRRMAEQLEEPARNATRSAPPSTQAEARKRWLSEIKFAKAKSESKAILRAVTRRAPDPAHRTSRSAPLATLGGRRLESVAAGQPRGAAKAIASLYGTEPRASAIPVRDDWVEPRA